MKGCEVCGCEVWGCEGRRGVVVEERSCECEGEGETGTP